MKLPAWIVTAIALTTSLHTTASDDPAVAAMQDALADLSADEQPDDLVSFAELQAIVGFPEYFEAEERYR